MRCPSCGYVRKPEDMAPEWQCPACQVAYAKASQQNTYTHSAPNSPPRGVSKPSSGAPVSFKAVFAVVLVGCALYFGYSFFNGNASAKGASIVRSIKSAFTSEQDNRETIANKKAELQAYEEALRRTDEEIENAKRNVGTCPITGQPNQFILTHDARPELQAKIEQLKDEIRQLENKS